MIFRNETSIVSFASSSLPFVVNKIYYWYSMIFLVVRMSIVFVIVSIITENARQPLSVFRSLPSEGWCEELQRFFNQLKSDSICFSGSCYFFITRKLLLRIFGILVTYELVLLEFDVGDDILDPFDCYD